jgi:hypothetical protein
MNFLSAFGGPDVSLLPLISDKHNMRMCEWFRVALLAALVMEAAPARAQLYESVGTRAQGMGGAFVAVADDATAGWWNPAGLASGAYFNVVVEKGRMTQPATPEGGAPAVRSGTSGFAAAFPSLGVSYYHLRVSRWQPATSTGTAGDAREDPGVAGRARSLSLSDFGVTVGQSLGDHLVIGSTLKLLRGGVGASDVDGSSDALDLADDLPVASHTRADLDVGAMAKFGRVQMGATVRNFTRPTFGEGEDAVVLPRQARAGVAVAPSLGPGLALTIAGDADMTSTPTLFGDVRHAATGAEAWLLQRRLGFRAGISANTIGARRPASSMGVSVAPIAGVYVEAARTVGADDSLRGWTTTVRFTF